MKKLEEELAKGKVDAALKAEMMRAEADYKKLQAELKEAEDKLKASQQQQEDETAENAGEGPSLTEQLKELQEKMSTLEGDGQETKVKVKVLDGDLEEAQNLL